MTDPALTYLDAPEPGNEAPEEEYGCVHCPLVFRGPNAWYELGGHEIEHIEATS